MTDKFAAYVIPIRVIDERPQSIHAMTTDKAGMEREVFLPRNHTVIARNRQRATIPRWLAQREGLVK